MLTMQQIPRAWKRDASGARRDAAPRAALVTEQNDAYPRPRSTRATRAGTGARRTLEAAAPPGRVGDGWAGRSHDGCCPHAWCTRRHTQVFLAFVEQVLLPTLRTRPGRHAWRRARHARLRPLGPSSKRGCALWDRAALPNLMPNCRTCWTTLPPATPRNDSGTPAIVQTKTQTALDRKVAKSHDAQGLTFVGFKLDRQFASGLHVIHNRSA